LPTANGGTNLTSFTANGVVYASSSSVLTTGSALVFDGSNLGVSVTPSAWASAYKVLDVGNTASLYLDSSGAVVSNNSFINSSFQYRYKTSNAATRYEQTSAGQHQWFNAASGTVGNDISFTQAMTLDASGNLLVGTTTSSGKLTVKQSSVSQTIYIDNASVTPYGMQIQYSGAAPNAASNEFIYCADTANNRFIVYSSGNAANRNNVYAGISDVKLKENIVDASPKLADLMQVKVRNYNLIGETTKQIGVVAQELETVFPSMVEESPDKDNERNDLGTTTKSVKYSVFVPMLIKAIQEQQALITQLTARITALESA
jgi:hypothetical protein